MQFSRSHAGMLGIVSIFTGMLAPGVTSETLSLPYPLTNMRWITYIILLSLIVGFYFVSTQKWKIHRFFSLLILGFLMVIAFSTATANVIDLKYSQILQGFSWGWVFFVVGAGLLVYTIQKEQGAKERENTHFFFDAIVGIMGSFTLACLSILIIYVSVIGSSKSKSENNSVLESILGTGQTESMSGGVMSQSYENISEFTFDRKKNRIIFATSEVGKVGKTYRDLTGAPQVSSWEKRVDSGINILFLESGRYIYDTKSDTLLSESGTIISENVQKIKDTYIIRGASGDTVIQGNKKKVLDTRYTIFEKNIRDITFGSDEKRIMSLISSGSISQIYQGDTLIHTLPVDWVPSSYMSNGEHFFYARESKDAIEAWYDGNRLQTKLDEVREVFLSRDGGAYGFFGRPLGEVKYCLFTRYSGNLCGLDGYMNPILGADGTSIIYAGYKGGVWRIYRNTYPIIQDTKYVHTDISGDYAFYDSTNPKTYIIIQKNSDGSYEVRKNGKIIPKVWKDVGTDVYFGYDNTVIMTAKDETGWRIIEI